MSWRTREIVSVLKRKGFHEERKTKHEFFRFHIEGKVTQVRTHVSHGHQEIRKGTSLFAAMARQLHLSNTELEKLLNCPLSQAGYIEVLRDKKVI